MVMQPPNHVIVQEDIKSELKFTVLWDRYDCDRMTVRKYTHSR